MRHPRRPDAFLLPIRRIEIQLKIEIQPHRVCFVVGLYLLWRAFMNYDKYIELLGEYKEQKRFEKYQKERILPRPKTNKLHIMLWICLFVAVLFGLIAASVMVPVRLEIRLAVGLTVISIFLELSLRFLGIKAVECYQHYASEERRRRCLCIPSCSEYAILCFKKYCFIKSIVKIHKRLYKTCTGDLFKKDLP